MPLAESSRELLSPAVYDPRALGADCARCFLAQRTRTAWRADGATETKPWYLHADYDGADARPDDPVPPETHNAATFTLLGEAPGIREVEEGHPFAGASGREEEAILLRALKAKRHDAHWLNALPCRPASTVGGDDSGSLKRLEAQLAGVNRERRSSGLTPLPHPIECCRPRVLTELALLGEEGDRVITLGDAAIRSIVPGHRGGVLNVRGGPITLRCVANNPADEVARGLDAWVRDGMDGPPPEGSPLASARVRKVMPTVHPAFVARAASYRDAALADHARAQRHFDGKLNWTDPAMEHQPSIARLAEFLGVERCTTGWKANPTKQRPLAYDFETTWGIDRSGKTDVDEHVRCIGIGNTKETICYQPLSREGLGWLYGERDRAEAKQILRAWATGPGLKVGWNSGYFDTLVFQAWLGADCVPAPHIDGIMVHHLVQPDLPHALAFVASILLDIMAWKAGKEASDADGITKTDATLRTYCMRDCAATAHVLKILMRYAAAEKLGTFAPTPLPHRAEHHPHGHTTGPLYIDQEMQRICRTMHRNGMLVDQPTRARHATKYAAIAVEHGARCRALIDDPGINLNSPTQVGALLFSKRNGGFGLEIPCDEKGRPFVTESGTPSVSDPACRSMLRDPLLAEKPRAWLLSYRRFKKADKLVSTFLKPVGTVLTGDPREAEAEEARDGAAKALSTARGLLADAIPNAAAWGGGLREDGRPKLDGADRAALRRVLFDVWQLPPVRTPKGGVTLSRDALLTHWRQPEARAHDSTPRKFLAAWFTYLRLSDEATRLGEPPGEDEEERCILHPDGRIHVDWKAHVVITGRLASSPNCFDGDTELLLRGRGWVPFRELLTACSTADGVADGPACNVAQWHPDGRVDFAQPTAWIKRHYRGDMVRFTSGQNIDVLTTPDHRAVVQARSGKWEEHAVPNVPWDRKWFHAGKYAGGTVAPPLPYLRFLVAAQADGHFPVDAPGICTFSFRKQRKINRLAEIAQDAAAWAKQAGVAVPLMLKEGKPRQNGGRRFSLRGAWVVEARQQLGTPKQWGAWLLEWTAAALDAFCDELWHWDGCITRRNHYSSSVAGNAAWVQTVLALRGHRAKVRTYTASPKLTGPNWQTDVVRDTPYSWTTNSGVTRVPWDDDVYCLSVPSSYVLVRRNGRISVIGQCQNIPRKVRSMFVPAPGNTYVYADMDTLELRVAAARWGLARYLEAFNTKKVSSDGKTYWMDPHQITMHAIFGDTMWTWEGAPPKEWRYYKKWPGGKIGGYFDVQRDLGKRVCLSGDTEVLTDRFGWARLDWFVLARPLCRVAQWNPVTGLQEWATPTDFVLSATEGWVDLDGDGVRLRATPEHRCPVQDAGGVIHDHRADAYPHSGQQHQGYYVGCSELRWRRTDAVRRRTLLLDRPVPAYCVTVPSSYLVVRYGKSVVITGNCYASLYAAEPPTVHNVITSAEDRDGNLIYADRTLRQVAAMQEAWLLNVPEVQAGWDAEMSLADAAGYILEPVSGRRFYFLDGLELNKVVNAPIQGAGAGLVSKGTIKFDRRYPEGHAGAYTGLINLTHDALVWEGPAAMGKRVAADMQECLTQTHPALPGVAFTAEAKVIPCWEPED